MKHGSKNLQKQTKGTKVRAGLAYCVPEGTRDQAPNLYNLWPRMKHGFGVARRKCPPLAKRSSTHTSKMTLLYLNFLITRSIASRPCSSFSISGPKLMRQ